VQPDPPSAGELELPPRTEPAGAEAAPSLAQRDGEGPAPEPLAFLRGGGAMGALVRETDWSRSPLGPAGAWPQSLKTSVSICLDSGFPVLLWWGPELIMLYNDAYRPILGDKHPRSMGQPGRECWPEIWHTIGPMLRSVLEEGKTSYFEDLMLPLHRRGFPEECYFTFTYSPIRDETGGVGGVFCAVTETTQRVYGERQVACLRDLAATTADARTYDQAAAATVAALARNASDVPFALLYLADPARRRFTLAGVAGAARGGPAVPEVVEADVPGPWPLAEVTATQRAQVVEASTPALAGAEAARPRPGQAVVLPVPASAGGRPGVLVAGVNPMRALDDGYRGFLDLVAGQLAASMANAQAYEEERKRADALAEIDRAKTTFFSNVSHEFRTPLTLMLGPLEDALRGGELTGQPLALVHRNGLRLLHLVNSLLHFARIEASRVEATYRPTDLAAVTAGLASNFRSAVERAGLRLVVDCPPLREPVFVDRDMWEKIVLNLLSNAFKFTFEGEIGVALRSTGAGVELTVRDTGVGIPDAELPRLFERFHRIRATRSRSLEGSGIGLALVKELVRLHGGRINAASRAGEGTTFVVAIPSGSAHLAPEKLGRGEDAAPESTSTEAFVEEIERWLPDDVRGRGRAVSRAETPAGPLAPGPAGTPGPERVLVADDNADMRDYLRSILGRRWTVEAVADGCAALAAARRAPPDLVLTDVMMPGLDGFELLRRLRGHPGTREVPVVMLSARAGEEARVEGAEAGADDYLVKPFSARELVARIATHLELARMRKEATRALRDSEARFREIADVAPVVLWVTGPDGACTFLNRRWSELTGQDPDRALGFGWLEPVHPEDAEAARDALVGANARRAPFRSEYRLRSAAGDWRWVIDIGTPRTGPDGEPLGFVGTVVDITERKHAEEAVLEADRRKTEFLAVLSHELRNPLAPIRNGVRILAHAAPGSGAARRAREIVDRQSEHLSRLVDDLLDITRISHGKIELQRERLDAREVVRRACADVEDAFQARGIALRYAEEPAPAWVDADAARLAQMVGNLLHNALKFTPAGGRVDAAVRRRAASCEVSVRDTGHGIERDDLDRIFEPFVQSGRTRGQAHGGMGLGLALVRELAGRHGGAVRVDSAGPGRGSEFVVELPLAPAPATAAPGPAAGGRAAPLRILVIEDNEDAGATLAELLALDGHEVEVVTSGRAGVAAAAARPPDAIVCDVGLPDLSGHDVIRAIRAASPGRHALAVALTGYAQPEDRALALAAGFDAHLPKPPALDELAALLARAAPRNGHGDAARP
jgi:PAS domain S-box-containing protein